MFKAKKVNHVAFAVWSIEKALPFFRDLLGAEVVSDVFEPSDRQHKVLLLSIGDMIIELMEPTDEQGFLARFLAKRGEGFNHIGLDVDDIKEGAELMKSKGIVIISERLDYPGMKYARAHPKSTHGVEFHLTEGRQSLDDFKI